ncbi:hypothetical protein PVAND_001393 [Polypedilum vanderplanki]|uniref:Aminopeptidase n=1 Tax=Polypedilum vanderplanki TaxID=319348 RepID=A0A9J6BP46_POLVA|nr:hypothetical protein PVAND_001393 [Polypedilum vanderplanki]
MPNQNNLIRPSSYSSSSKQHLDKVELSRKRTSILILTLISLVIFLFILSLLLICALVVVGKGLSQKNDSLSDINTQQTVSSISLINHLSNNINKNKIDTSTESKFSVNGNSMSMNRIVDNLTFRLPRQITPSLYNLFLHPDLKKKTFRGNVKIDIQVSEQMPFLALHSKFLNITQVKLMKSLVNGKEGLNVKNSFMYDKFEFFIIEPEQPLAVGNYTVDLDFEGSLDGKIVGFYGSSYLDKMKNQTRYIATSKFEPTFARQSFPCFDEPSMKAKFKISLISPKDDGYHALSNMNVESIEDYDENFMKYNFFESVPMSTYLTVFIVSNFQNKSQMVNVNSTIGEPFLLSVYSTPQQIDKTDYALETAKKVIEYYIQYFNIKYPLPKLDLAAIPDFVSGAMETWGLVTYRETNLLYDAKVSSTANKQRIASVISHELAHMYFGNLVSMRWWNDLFLNEGFASYIEFKGEMAAEEDWDMMSQFTIDTMHSVLDLDATLGSHPIVVGVETPDQITEIFDSITYNKGASVIRMIEDFVGEENFRKGVTEYLNEKRFGNADADDLLRNLKPFTDLDIFSIVNTFIRQKGIAVVTVEKIGNELHLTQKRFLTDPESESQETLASEYNYKWSLPITYFTNNNKTVQREWFYHTAEKLIIPIDDADWVKVNKDQIGYYRVNYDKSMWESLNEALKADINVMSVLDRAHLLNDVFSLAQGQKVDYATALKMTEFLQKETSFVPWDAVSTKLKNIRNLLYNTEYFTEFKDYVNNLVDATYKNISWEVNINAHLDNLKRITILDLACSFDHVECMNEVGIRFRQWLNNPDERPHPDLRSLIYYHGMRSVGNKNDWDKMFEIFAAENDATEKSKLQSALAAIQDPVILMKYIELASANETYVRSQDYFNLLASVAGNRAGEMLVWDFVRMNWEKLVQKFTLNERNLGRMIPNVTNKFSSEIRLKEMQNFFNEYPEAGAGANARKQALENIQNNIKWLKNNKQSIGDFLQSLNL